MPVFGSGTYVYFASGPGRWMIRGRDRKSVNYSRAVMAAHIGRWPERHEHVHHINGDKTDDRIENLQLLSWAEHQRVHRVLNRWSRDYDECTECGGTEARYEARGLCARCYQRRRYRNLSPEQKADRYARMREAA